jgi:hypothetical protein
MNFCLYIVTERVHSFGQENQFYTYLEKSKYWVIKGNRKYWKND